jgi:hypothetical protein
VHPGRILGIVLGIVILASIFALPFFGGSNPYTGTGGTFYSGWSDIVGNLGNIQAVGNAQLITLAYIILIAGILLIIAGFVGIFPLGTGVLGVVGMAMLTVGPYVATPTAGTNLSVYGAGFYVMWVASIAALGASFWHRRDREGTKAVQQVVVNTGQQQPPPPPANVNVTTNVTQTQGGTTTGMQTPPAQGQAGMAATVKCPKCGTMNTATAKFCTKCDAALT